MGSCVFSFFFIGAIGRETNIFDKLAPGRQFDIGLLECVDLFGFRCGPPGGESNFQDRIPG